MLRTEVEVVDADLPKTGTEAGVLTSGAVCVVGDTIADWLPAEEAADKSVLIESGVLLALSLIGSTELRLYFMVLLLRREFGFVWILECLVSSSEREKRFVHPGNVHACGFSPV